MCSPTWTLHPPPSPNHPSGSSQCTSPKHPASCIEPGLASRFIHDISHVSMPFSQIVPPSPSPTESKRLFYMSVSLLLSWIQGYRYHLSKSHIYALVYCIGVLTAGSPGKFDNRPSECSVCQALSPMLFTHGLAPCGGQDNALADCPHPTPQNPWGCHLTS